MKEILREWQKLMKMKLFLLLVVCAGFGMLAYLFPHAAMFGSMPFVFGMSQLFSQHEHDIVTLQPENSMFIIGSYAGNADETLDKAAADAVLANLFPGRFKEDTTIDSSAKTATLSGGAFNSELVPIVYRNDVLCNESEYTFVAGTGVFTFTTLAPTDEITVTLGRGIYGVNSCDPVADFPVKVTDVKAAGSINYVYRTTTYDDSKYTVNIKGAYDVRKLRRKYPTMDLEKAVFGSQWNSASGGANKIERNANPFFVAIIWWYPDADTGELLLEKEIFYACTLQKGILPKFEGTDKEASYEIDASAMYAYRTKTLA